MRPTDQRSPAAWLDGASAFSLIEVVFAIAIVGFALIAILGLLPMALDGERQSRDETHMSHIASQIFSDLQSRGTFETEPGTTPGQNEMVPVLPYSVYGSATKTAYYSPLEEQLLAPTQADATSYKVTLSLAAPPTGLPVTLGPNMALATLTVAHNISSPTSILGSQTFLQLIGSYP